MRFVVHLHEDVFYDVPVEADDENEADDKARGLLYGLAFRGEWDDIGKYRTGAGLEWADVDDPIELVPDRQERLLEPNSDQ